MKNYSNFLKEEKNSYKIKVQRLSGEYHPVEFGEKETYSSKEEAIKAIHNNFDNVRQGHKNKPKFYKIYCDGNDVVDSKVYVVQSSQEGKSTGKWYSQEEADEIERNWRNNDFPKLMNS